jgi:hypothetical protein
VSQGNLTPKFNDQSAYEFTKNAPLNLLEAIGKFERMDLGYYMTASELASLPPERQKLVTSDESYIPFEVRENDPEVIESMRDQLEEGERHAFFIEDHKVTSAEFLKFNYRETGSWSFVEDFSLEVRSHLLNTLSTEDFATLSVGLREALR